MSIRFVTPLVVALTPLAAVLVNFVWAGVLTPAGAVLPGLAAAAGVAALLTLHTLRQRATTEAVDAMLETLARPAPPGLPLERRIARLQEAWQQEHAQLRNLLDSRKTVLDLLPAPYLMIDAHSRIVRSNLAGEQLFGSDLTERSLAAVVRDPPLLEAVALALKTDTPQQLDWMQSQPEERFFQVHIEPVPLQPHVRTRAIIAFSDITSVQRSQRATTDFIANASHELRTPLTSLVGFIETLQGPAREDPVAQADFLAIMHDEASRMARLVQDLLSLSRIERTLHEHPIGQVDLAAVARRTVQALGPQVEARQMQVCLAIDSVVPVLGDSDELAQMCLNLIDNAIKYGDPGTSVTVSVRVAGGAGLFAVRNQGEGIASEDIPRLTERFFRTRSTRNRGDTGTGLGLAIVQKIINRHRGHLRIASVVGDHSEFTVTLPLASGACEMS
jgi:two-component system, OmpR family, phosphate regulon sensor histidine kinase PhoR